MKPPKYLPNTNKMKKVGYLFGLLLVLGACKTTKQLPTKVNKDEVTFKFIQLNDVYEIAPLSGGKYGGMARVAHVVDSVRAVEPNTFLVMAGDFLNPSLLGTVKVDGERLRGKQMIEVMNAMDFDLVTFGNHEFDLGVEDLQKRLNESTFEWTTANAYQVLEDGNSSFNKVVGADTIRIPETKMLMVKDNDSIVMRIGVFSVTIDSNPVDYVYYSDYQMEAQTAYTSLDIAGADVIFGLTHLEVEQDEALLDLLPNVPFIMGGHEHNNMLVHTKTGIVAKADANAKTVYIHSFTFNKKTNNLKIDSHLMPLDEKTASKPTVKAIVDRWNSVLENKIKEVIDDPNEVIYFALTPLDGTDSASRGVQTNLGEIITHAMALSFDKEVEAAIVNGGSIRLDDILADAVTSIDIFRVLPFGGNVVKVKMTGALLIKVLDFGKSKGGTGAYLQRYNLDESSTGGWLLEGNPIESSKTYTVAMSDFLMKGFDIPFLTSQNPGVLDVYEPKTSEAASDIRKAIILYLKSIKK